MTHILIIMLLHANGLSVESVEFANADACLRAQQAVMSALDGHRPNGWGGGARSGMFLSSTCVAKE